MDNYHITKSGDHWILKKRGAERASKTADTKSEIIKLAVEFLEGKTASPKIHKEDGTIQEERTYPRSADPTRTKGCKVDHSPFLRAFFRQQKNAPRRRSFPCTA